MTDLGDHKTNLLLFGNQKRNISPSPPLTPVAVSPLSPYWQTDGHWNNNIHYLQAVMTVRNESNGRRVVCVQRCKYVVYIQSLYIGSTGTIYAYYYYAYI